MAIAYECDKCKNLVKEAEHNVEIRTTSYPKKALFIRFYEEKIDNHNEYEDDEKDIPIEVCEECQIKLMEEALELMKAKDVRQIRK